MIHELAQVHTENIGKGTSIWQYSIILKNAIIGDNCNINCHVFIENDVEIKNNVTIKSGVYLWDGLTVENNVFIGPNVTFINDERPRSKQYPVSFQRTILREYCSIGAAAVILGGLIIGEYAMVGAGSLVTKNVPARALVFGSPALIVGWLNNDGTKMKHTNGKFYDNFGAVWEEINGELYKK
ncbi:MAG: N-acetyltransferase [Bacteroidetes bacterium]|nr:N-acetyltransferase [Bacteroidota bacterium]